SSLCPAVLHDDIANFDIAGGSQTLMEALDTEPVRGGTEKTDAVHLPRLLCLRDERRGEHPRQRGHREAAAVHLSSARSARASSDGGIVRPRALAVLRLMTSSNFVGFSKGRLAAVGLLRILS